MLRRILRRFGLERGLSDKDEELEEIAEAQRFQHERDVIMVRDEETPFLGKFKGDGFEPRR